MPPPKPRDLRYFGCCKAELHANNRGWLHGVEEAEIEREYSNETEDQAGAKSKLHSFSP
eukprot:CAMPEP_0119303328 /NCGR_PEP_ID=MMETSP1333-20130426/4781_1 /TAXON_ID=418940 /ORGANISM="Scyphosphaera apsteinii, Strain RCC1455" /LENGTH=58 /DNA_ID=CAMNT_0007305977 /DNA_START=421 /DNA_END=597 /DNA_ORIENTATION=+